jgi:Ca2+/Na+ antiporter
MSFNDRLVLWLHIGFAIFALGPVTVAILSTPRYIRARNQTVVGYLLRTTRIYAVLSLGVLLFGLILAQLKKDFSHPWLTVSMTLFVVALVLLVLIMRDQRKAVTALELAAAAEAPAAGTPPAAAQVVPVSAEQQAGDAEAAGDAEPVPANQPGSPGAPAPQIATVERGRIATMGGVVALIYLVILILMVWNT